MYQAAVCMSATKEWTQTSTDKYPGALCVENLRGLPRLTYKMQEIRTLNLSLGSSPGLRRPKRMLTRRVSIEILPTPSGDVGSASVTRFVISFVIL